MGNNNCLQLSRESSLPSFIDDDQTRELIRSKWDVNEIRNKWHSNSELNKTITSTMCTERLEMAGKYMKMFLDENYGKTKKPLNILEIMAGNDVATYDLLKNCDPATMGTVITTDIVDCYPDCMTVDWIEFHCHDAIDAVKNHGDNSDILLIICPPPYEFSEEITSETICSGKMLDGSVGYADYYAYKDFINMTLAAKKTGKYIVFVGELGASDGSIGTYKYLLTHPSLTLLTRELLKLPGEFDDEDSGKYSRFNFGPVEKEFYIFQINV